MSLSQWMLLVLLSLLWGGSFLFVGVATHELPPFTIVLVRVGLAASLLTPLVYALGLSLPTRAADWHRFAVMAILNNIIPFLLIVRGQQAIASGLASVLNATTPLFAVILTRLLVPSEKLVLHKLSGVVVGIAGVAILMGPEALLGRTTSLLGMLCVLGAAFSYGLSAVWGRRLRHDPPLVTSSAQLLCSTMVLMPLTLAIDRPWTMAMPGTAVIGAVVGLAVLSTALAYIVFFRIMAVSGPTNAMLVTLLIPVSAILFGNLFLGEELLARQLLGAAVIGISLALIDGRVLALAAQLRAGRVT
jgi:drug/metabolite transporter (DMT)-like permease